MQQKIANNFFAVRIASDASSNAVALATVDGVRLLIAELRPLVGDVATIALYSRGLYLAQSAFQRPPPSDPKTPDQLLAELHSDLERRSAAESKLAASRLLQSLVDLLISLIGRPLTYRIIGTAWSIPASELPFEEKPQ